MTLRQYVSFLAFGSITATAAWLLVVLFLDPTSANVITLGAFYISLFAAIVGIATTIATTLRVWRFPKREVADIVYTSLRQAIFFAILVEITLFLVRLENLRWWAFLIALFVLSVIEYFFLLKQSKLGSEKS